MIAASPLGLPTAPLPPFFLEETEEFLGRPTGLPERLSLSILYRLNLVGFLVLFLYLFLIVVCNMCLGTVLFYIYVLLYHIFLQKSRGICKRWKIYSVNTQLQCRFCAFTVQISNMQLHYANI